MAGVLAITAAAEYLPFPSSDERALAGSKSTRAGGGTPGKKAKPRRSYGNTSSTSASFSAEGVRGEHLQDGEHSNLSCESNSSGHSGGGGVHGSGVKSSASVATSASAISANFLATYGTPAMVRIDFRVVKQRSAD